MAMKLDYDRNNPVVGFEEQDLERCLKVEEEFMPRKGYAQSKEVILRTIAVKVILENSRCYNFNAFVPYLALVCFDRFISKNRLPNVLDRVRDEVVLVANCCLMIAYKTRPDTFDVLHFLVKTKMIKHERHILTVELVILNALKWNLEVTAISFVNMVIPRIPGAENIKRRVVNEIIIQVQGGITFITKFRPSVIAAAAIITACRRTLREMQPICYNWIVDTKFVNKVDLEACFAKLLQMCIEKEIIMVTDRKASQSPRVRAASRSPTKEPKLHISDTDAERIFERRHGKEPRLGSSDADTDRKFERRPGKEPMSLSKTKNKAVAIPENKIDDSELDVEMNFKLKWMLWITNPEEIEIDSPRFRPVAAATTPLISFPAALVANRSLMNAWKMRHRTLRVLEFVAKTDMIEQQKPHAKWSSEAEGSSRPKGSSQIGGSSQTGGSFRAGGSSQAGGSSSSESGKEPLLQETSETKDTEVDSETKQRYDIEPPKETSGTKDTEVDPETGQRHCKEPPQETSETKDAEVEPKTQLRHEKEPRQETSATKATIQKLNKGPKKSNCGKL
ncbi:hypothetical protein Patl1_04519 [Pistacia atlantica]|uniref:Uncharacterized protein n=1 Tax=Pistacia atlantica TaxID=434234 RepID=A0ACC1BRL2_9ROSI|nr:hypothetical protein Patl1_04519 [Pistacia atlantica]